MPLIRYQSVVVVSLGVSWLSLGVVAQQPSFQWGFNDLRGTTLPQCQPLPIFVNEDVGTVRPVPPYYLAAYEGGGVNTINYVGNKVGNLTWTVNHLTGVQLVLVMFDSIGNSGGVLTDTYTIAGQTTGANASCITTTTPAITVTSNSTSKINTCDSIQLSISGGRKPYRVTVAETNAVAPSNITMGSKDDIYTWVNNLSPGNEVIIVVSDSDENYGRSTSLMTLSGSLDTHCPTSSTSSSNSTDGSNNGGGGGNGNKGNGNDGDGNSSSGGNRPSSKIGIIAGVVIAAFFSIFFGLLAWFFIRRRRQSGGGVRESRIGWTIDRNDSMRISGGRARLPSDPSESDVTPFTLPQSTHMSPPTSVRGYSDNQARPFIPRTGGPNSHLSESTRGTFYRDHVESEADERDAYALDAFRTSGIGSSSGSQTRSNGQESQFSRSFRVVNEDGEHHGNLREQTKGFMAQNTDAQQQQRQVFQHEDAGIITALDEIPPAYPGLSTAYGER